jgi:UDP:flavonoid glycosyltransferase YjiC (YdhE family)
MTRYLFTTQASNDLGLLTRTLPVARELAQRGHQVAFCNSAAAPHQLITEAGFENLPQKHPLHYLTYLRARGEWNKRGLVHLRREFSGVFGYARQVARAMPTRFALPTAQMWSVDHLMAIIGMRSAGAVCAECASLLALMTDYQADVVVDSWNPFACVAARAAGKPLVTILQADIHPLNRGFMWWQEPPPKLPTVAPSFSKVMAEYGLPPIRKVEEVFVGDLTLVVGLPETDPLPEAANVIYVGAILWQTTQAQLPDWFDDLSCDRPVVWVYSGNPRYLPVPSPLDGHAILRACIEALRDEDIQVVLTTGYHALPKNLLPLPSNFRYARYVPGLTMAQRSDLMIHHGGYGSCQTGLYTGTPAVIIPTFSERESNARRVAAAGAGEFLLPGGSPFGPLTGKWGVRAEDLRAKVRQILDNPAYTHQARCLSEKLRSYGGAAEAARLIEDLGAANGDHRIAN